MRDYLKHLPLDESELEGKRILDLMPGPSSFAIEATLLGALVFAVDTGYRYHVERLRVACLHLRDFEGPLRFLRDYPAGVAAGRYRADLHPSDVFLEKNFDLILYHTVDTDNNNCVLEY